MLKNYSHKIVLVILWAVSTVVFADTLPTAVSAQLPAGFKVLDFKSAHFTDSKKTDYLVVAYKENEKQLAEQGPNTPRRPLLIFMQNDSGIYSLVARNDHVVFAVNEGGQCDPFLDGGDGLAVKGPFFTVQNSVACGAHWTDYFTFKYEPALRNFVFHKRIYENWISNPSTNPDADALILGKRVVTSGDKNKPVFLSNYRWLSL